MLGVGSIPSVELGSGDYKSQSTNVPINGAYILAEDQNGVGAYFGSSRNYFDYSGGKNTIATTSENLVIVAGNFSTAEQGSLVSQQLTGVCNSSGGCTGNSGIQTSVNSYKLYPSSFGDFYSDGGTPAAAGKFSSSTTVVTQSPTRYWLRSSDFYYNNHSMWADPSTDVWVGSGVVDYSSGGFRPA